MPTLNDIIKLSINTKRTIIKNSGTKMAQNRAQRMPIIMPQKNSTTIMNLVFDEVVHLLAKGENLSPSFNRFP